MTDNINKNIDNELKILNRLNNIKKNILAFINAKLKISITGEEIKLNLNNKNIGNYDLILLSGVNFKNLEELYLSHNNISSPEIIEEFNLNKLKKLDLSYNKINSINKYKLNKVYLSLDNNGNNKNESNKKIFDKNIINNKIINVNKDIKINLNNNNLIKKEIEEIKNNILTDYNNNINSNIKDNKQLILNKIIKLEKKILSYLNDNL